MSYFTPPEGHETVLSKDNLNKLPSFTAALVQEILEDLDVVGRDTLDITFSTFRTEIHNVPELISGMLRDLIFKLSHDLIPSFYEHGNYS
jgi:hypothetical protein